MKTFRSIYKTYLLLTIAFFVLISLPDQTKACSCAGNSLQGEIDNSSNIIVAKMKSVVKTITEDEKRYFEDGIKSSIFEVQKVFKGDLKVGQTLKFEQGVCCICVMAFSEKSIGNEYLFYLGKNPNTNGLWSGSVCSRSGDTQYTAVDLIYFNKLPQVKGKTRLAGRLIVFDLSTNNKINETDYLSGASIKIIGNGKTIDLKTDKNGVFEIYDLPVGEYQIQLEDINVDYEPMDREYSTKIKIKKGELVDLDFYFTSKKKRAYFLNSIVNPYQNVSFKLFNDTNYVEKCNQFF